jgi:SAM-dependent methyltransferase
MNTGAGVWKHHSSQWQHVGAPFRPGEEDAELMMGCLAPILAKESHPIQVAVLGVTPEVVNLPWPTPVRLQAYDESLDMVKRVWRPNPRVASSARVARWQSLPLPDKTMDAVVGDGVLYVLSGLSACSEVLVEIQRVLKPHGTLAVRCFVRPDSSETVENIREAAYSGEIGGFHALKMRLSMALAESATYSFEVSEVHRAFTRLFPDRAFLSRRTGWPLEAIDTIDAYQHATTRYTCPTLSVLSEIWEPFFNLEAQCRGQYELAKRCPTLCLLAK